MRFRSSGSIEGDGMHSIFIVLFLLVAILVTIGAYTVGTASLTYDVALKAALGAGLNDLTVSQASPNFLYFQCGEGDTAHRDVHGTNANGDSVSIIVCGGWFKAATVRYP